MRPLHDSYFVLWLRQKRTQSVIYKHKLPHFVRFFLARKQNSGSCKGLRMLCQGLLMFHRQTLIVSRYAALFPSLGDQSGLMVSETGSGLGLVGEVVKEKK